MIWWWVATAAALLLGFLTLGIPGALWVVVSTPVLRVLFGRDWRERMSGDRAWPAMLMIAFLWPAAIVPARLLAARVAPAGWEFWGVVLGTIFAGGLLVTVIVVAAAGPPSSGRPGPARR